MSSSPQSQEEIAWEPSDFLIWEYHVYWIWKEKQLTDFLVSVEVFTESFMTLICKLLKPDAHEMLTRCNIVLYCSEKDQAQNRYQTSCPEMLCSAGLFMEVTWSLVLYNYITIYGLCNMIFHYVFYICLILSTFTHYTNLLVMLQECWRAGVKPK